MKYQIINSLGLKAGLLLAGLACTALSLPAQLGAPPAKATPIPPGEIIGRVELVPGVPIHVDDGCRVFLEGTPLGARLETDGSFDIRRVPVGRWDLRIVCGDLQKRVGAGANPGEVTDVGVIVLSAPGSISGQVALTYASKIGTTIVGVPEFGLYVQLNAAGGYLINGVPPGSHDVVVLNGMAPKATELFREKVAVNPLQLTRGVNFAQPQAADPSTLLQEAPAQKSPAGREMRAPNR